MTSDPVPAPTSAPPSPAQFGLSGMLGCFIALGMALAYLRQFNSTSVFVNAMFVATFAVGWGTMVGSLTNRRRETIFWSVIVAACGYLSVVGETRYGVAVHYVWSAVGALAGTAAAAVRSGPVRRIVMSCLCGSVPMVAYYIATMSQRVGLEFDLLAAVVVSALVGLLVELVMWVERNSKIPRYATASWLLCAVIIGNLLVPLVLA